MRGARLVLVLLALCACSTSAGSLQDGGLTTTPRASTDATADAQADAALDPDASALDAAQSGPSAEDAALPPGCALPRAARTFVGFSPGMTLDDFELAAFQAERLLDMLEAELCAHAARLDRSGTLARQLEAHEIEVFEIVFVRDDATEAEVSLRRVGEEAAAYRLEALLGAEGWMITRAEPVR